MFKLEQSTIFGRKASWHAESVKVHWFSNPDSSGRWVGLDVDICRAVAAAVLGDAEKVKFVPLASKQKIVALASTRST